MEETFGSRLLRRVVEEDGFRLILNEFDAPLGEHEIGVAFNDIDTSKITLSEIKQCAADMRAAMHAITDAK